MKKTGKVDPLRVVELYEGGASLIKVGKLVGKCDATVKAILIKQGVRIRAKPGGDSTQRKFKPRKLVMLTEADIEQDFKTRLYK